MLSATEQELVKYIFAWIDSFGFSACWVEVDSDLTDAQTYEVLGVVGEVLK